MKLYKILSVALLFIIGCSEKEVATFTQIESPAGENSSLPRLFIDESGTVFMSWVEEKGNLAELKYSTFEDSFWSDPKVIAKDSTWFLNWADYPSIIARDGAPFAAHWLNKKTGGTYSYDVNISTYQNGDWASPIKPHEDETPTEHGFASMIPMSDSTFLAVWLDGRETENRDHNEYSNIEKAMTLRGAVIHKNGSILHKYLIDDSVCDCCSTSLTKTNDGYMLVYRDRTNEEIRDINYTKFKDGVWSEPKPIHSDNWKIAACPVNGPSVDSEDGTVAIAWFTGANEEPAVKLSVSNDDGKTFSEAILLDTKGPIGRVDVEVSDDKIWASWLSAEKPNGHLKIASFTKSGKLLETHIVEEGISSERQAGFPELEIVDRKLLVAYTEVIEKEKRVKNLIYK
ncbi:MAG: hypothetical protein CL670_10100 [Balneola sp.]|jgi:hypothetical protein|nr:hypothetical protein [Balneola sp.]MBE79494.1 hypothetical protein [Balneola sp.]|tara:strand:+ start:159 stop:1358 length:1200 start_codon:yes stop_codon:yes gene_type:complete